MNLFQFAIVFKGDDDRDAKILHAPTTQLATDANQVMLLAARLIPEEYLLDLDLVQIAVRPFLRTRVEASVKPSPASRDNTRLAKKTFAPVDRHDWGTGVNPVWTTTGGTTINWLEPTVSDTVYTSASSLV